MATKNTPTKKKSVAPIIKPVIKHEPDVTAKTTTTRSRESVLVKVTAAKLQELIGTQEIGVSRKELKALISKSITDKALANAGL